MKKKETKILKLKNKSSNEKEVRDTPSKVVKKRISEIYLKSLKEIDDLLEKGISGIQ